MTTKPQDASRTGAQCVVDGLEKHGCTVLFGLPGGAVLDIFDRLADSPIKFVLVRHEQGAVHMADGYARATGRVGCCIVTSGPGATNAVTGLATAAMDGVPLVCIAGQVPLSMIGNDAFQEADTTGITRPVTKHNYLVHSADELPRILAEAFLIAATGKPGPVLIDIPKDVQRATTTVPDPDQVVLRSYSPEVQTDYRQADRLVEAINASERPVFYVGGGAITANASDALTRLARKASIPVTTTLLGLGAFPETDPLALRMLGMHGSVAANNAVHDCDLLVALGARFDDRVTGKISAFASRATIAHVDIDASTICKSVHSHLNVVGDVRTVLEYLAQRVEPRDRSPWLRTVQAWQSESPFGYEQPEGMLLPQYVIEQIHAVSKGEAIIATEVGQHQMWAAHFYRFTRPRTFLSSGGLGTMGYGMPAAIGAQIAFPDRIVVDIAGDGSIQMNMQELVVAVEHQLPINVVILNNGYLGMVRQWQQMFYNGRYTAVRLGQSHRPKNEQLPGSSETYLPDFVKLAEAHGACGVRVQRVEDVVPALREAFDSPRPWLVECIVSPETNVYPMVPPNASLKEMILSLA